MKVPKLIALICPIQYIVRVDYRECYVVFWCSFLVIFVKWANWLNTKHTYPEDFIVLMNELLQILLNMSTLDHFVNTTVIYYQMLPG